MVTVKQAKKNINFKTTRPLFFEGLGWGRSFNHNAFNSANDFRFFLKSNVLRISSDGRALDCRAGGRGFDSRDRNNTRGLKMTEK